MKRFIPFLIALVLVPEQAFADLLPQRVLSNGKVYSTGYIHRELKDTAGITYWKPSSELIANLPESYDARVDGLVTAIKNQGSCGSCWSFARAKALEAARIKAGYDTKVIDLAEQDALVNDRTAYGCGGGFMDGDYETQKGVTTEALCPYRGNDRVSCSGAKYAKATRWAMVGTGAPSDDDLRAAIYQYGVLAVTVAAGGSFSPNSDGRITTCGGRGLNHMVTLVAYRPASNGGYEFLIANSWGTSWGQGGFAWSKRGCNQLASVAGDAALFFYIEGVGPQPDPDPDPLPPSELQIPIETVIHKGHETALQIRPIAGWTYKWSTGQTASRIYVQPAASQTYSLEVKKPDGTKITQSTKVTVK
jgi:hypothetical protein